MNLAKLIEAYVKSKSGRWSEKTVKMEQYRLKDIKEEHLKSGQVLYDYLVNDRKLKPYTVKNLFTRVADLVEFAIRKGVLPVADGNSVRSFIEEHANKFKNVYVPKTVAISFDEAMQRIEQIKDEDSRDKAYELLFTGMRVSESLTLDGEHKVETKGGGHRDVPLARGQEAVEYTKNRTTLYRHLKKVGLTPHMLRKLCATQLVEDGAQEADLMKAMGWRSSQMASIYVQARRIGDLKKKMDARRATNRGTKKHGK